MKGAKGVVNKAKKLGKGVLAKTALESKKESKVKVVEVALKGSAQKVQTSIISKSNPKSQAKSAFSSAKERLGSKVEKVAITKKSAKCSNVVADPAPVVSPLQVQKDLIAELSSPTSNLLKPFREAAKNNKKLARAREKAKKTQGTFLAKPPKKGKKFLLDLRVHSPASEGYSRTVGIDPGPALVRLANAKELDMIAVTDYYHTSYIDEVKREAEGTKVLVIPGVDVRASIGGCHEVQLVLLFPESYCAADVESVLNELRVPANVYGKRDFVLSMKFSEIIQIVENRGGIVIPSRIDKTPYRQLAIRTLIEEHGFHAFDLVHVESPDFFKEHWPTGSFTFFSFSNATALGQVGSRVAQIKMESGGFEGLRALVKRRVSQ